MDNITKLNKELKQIELNHKTQTNLHKSQSSSLSSNNQSESLQQQINQNIQESNAHNDKLQSFIIDSSLYNINNNHHQQQFLKNNNNNTRQQYYQETNNNQPQHNNGYINISRTNPEFKDTNAKYHKHLINQRMNEYSPLGRSMAIPVDIEYQINETFKNSRKPQQIHNSDITNQRLSQLSPLPSSSNIPINNRNGKQKFNNLKTHLDSENTISQSSLNTNYKN